MTFKEQDKVTVSPEIMQDESQKTNHHLFKRIIAENEIGTVRDFDDEKSAELNANLWWVKFHVAAIRIDEKYLVKVEGE